MKRLFDISFSFIGLVVLLPLLLIISLIIIIDSRGGVFYFQNRVGRNLRNFQLIKFRTMYTGSEKKGLITIGKRDKRVTKIGHLLRKYKLDELPQLINILKGDMSFVGPRPEVRQYIDHYTDEQLKVLEVKPGLTDYASIEFYNESELLENSEDPEKAYIYEIMPVKLNLNLKYIKEKSMLTDIKIILYTIKKIIFRK